MKYIQDNGKIKLCETDNMDHLVRLTQALNENNILYETRLKKGTFINNLFILIFYHTFASGIDHKNETTCIYVLEKDFAAAQKAINPRQWLWARSGGQDRRCVHGQDRPPFATKPPQMRKAASFALQKVQPPDSKTMVDRQIPGVR